MSLIYARRRADCAQRLLNLGVPAQLLADIERTREVPTHFTLSAPRDGIVLSETLWTGMRVMPGDVMFRLADQSVVWALVDVAERDLAAVSEGQSVMVRVRGYPDRTFPGTVALVYPYLNAGNPHSARPDRTCQPDLLLKPDMYAEAEIDTGGDRPVLAVPDSAVIDSGDRQVVLVDKGEGRFEPRAVQLGRRGAGYVEIRDGLKDGETVVTSANFLIDAESNLKSALQIAKRCGSDAMIERIIAASARNLTLILIGTLFMVLAGVYAVLHTPLDAIPDLSDTQVIVYTEYPGQAPQVVEDQVTYPLASAMLTVPKSRVVRGFSYFGVSFVYVIFEDGTDIYWARSRVLEYLSAAARDCPTA